MIVLDFNCESLVDVLKIASLHKSEPILVPSEFITDIIQYGSILLREFVKKNPKIKEMSGSEINDLYNKIGALEMYREAKYEHYKLANEIVKDFVNIFEIEVDKNDIPVNNYHREKIPVRSVFKDVSLLMLCGVE